MRVGASAFCERQLTDERPCAYGSRPVGVDVTMRSGERREGDRRARRERRRRRTPVADDRRLVADRRRGARRDGLAARLLRCVG